MTMRDQIIERLREARGLRNARLRNAMIEPPFRGQPVPRDIPRAVDASVSPLGGNGSQPLPLGGPFRQLPDRALPSGLPTGAFIHEDASISEPTPGQPGGVSSGFRLGHDPEGNFQRYLRQFESGPGGTGGAPLPFSDNGLRQRGDFGTPFRGRSSNRLPLTVGRGVSPQSGFVQYEDGGIGPGFGSGGPIASGGVPLDAHFAGNARDSLRDIDASQINIGGSGGQPLPAGGIGRAEGVAAGPEDDEAQLALEAARQAAGVSPLGPGAPNVRVFGGTGNGLRGGLGRIPSFLDRVRNFRR